MTLYSSADDPTDVAFLERVTEEILRPSFEDDEFPDDKSLVDGFAGGQVVAVATQGSTPLGVAVADTPNVDGIVLFSYLAASPHSRGTGVGGTLIRSMIDHWGTDDLVKLVLGEIHDPRLHAESETERPADRVRFYQRHGAEVLDVPWIQPALGAGTSRVKGMLLVSLYRAQPFAGTVIPSDPVQRWAAEYFADSEHFGTVENLQDFLPHTLSKRFAASPTISVLPLADYEMVVPLEAPGDDPG